MRDWLKEKTTIVGFVGATGLIVLLILLAMKILSATDFGIAAGAWATGIISLVGIFASDRKPNE